MKALIVDDDSRVVNIISKLIETDFADISVVASAEDVETGLKCIERFKPDLLFLDINLPDGTGFDILKRIEHIDFKIIFITAFGEYALQAIKFSALDYIMKPIEIEELAKAIEKAREIIHLEEEQLKVKSLLENFEEKKSLRRIVLHTSECLHYVYLDEIIRCEADNNYTFFYLTKDRKILVSKTLKEFAELLKDSGFLRVHQSHLINSLYVDRFVKSDGGYLLMKDKSNVPVSMNNRQQILKALDSTLF
jgi:two-component system LytT family response regulator